MFYYMELPDTEQTTLNTAFTYILNRFPHLSDGLFRIPPEQRQAYINAYIIHSLKWSSDGKWLGWGGPRSSNEVVVPFPSEGLVIGVL